MTQSTQAVEVTTDSFHQEVLEKSKEMPVLVDYVGNFEPCDDDCSCLVRDRLRGDQE